MSYHRQPTTWGGGIKGTAGTVVDGTEAETEEIGGTGAGGAGGTRTARKERTKEKEREKEKAAAEAETGAIRINSTGIGIWDG